MTIEFRYCPALGVDRWFAEVKEKETTIRYEGERRITARAIEPEIQNVAFLVWIARKARVFRGKAEEISKGVSGAVIRDVLGHLAEH